MILWILAIIILASVALVNYYQGAVRAAFSLAGLLFAALLAVPLSGLIKPLLRLTGLEHPVLLGFIAPAVVWVIILAVFKIVGLTIHKKIDTHYKYKESDTQRLLFERLNQRVGICVGLVNGVIYMLILSAVLATVGYFTVQVAGGANDSFSLKMVSFFHQGVQSTGMNKAVAPFMPRKEAFYDIADVLGLIYHNPLIQSRLSTYPVFLTLAEKPEFQAISADVQFQEFWQRQPSPSVSELIAHEKIKPLVESTELYTNVVAMLGGDLQDFKGYLETGKSAKYDEETILGRWDFNYRESMLRTRKTKPAWTTIELRKIRNTLSGWQRAVITATIDNQVIVKLGNSTLNGTWKNEGGGRYSVKMSGGGRSMDVEVTVEERKMVFALDGVTAVFDK
jgi:hypothetical protein